MNQPLVSIIIPTYNSASTLARTLESVKKQTYSNIEVSIVDSHSTDETKIIAQRYGTAVYETNWKLLGARKMGAEKARGEYVLLLDSDQILKSDAIARAVEKIEKENLDMLFLGERSYNPFRNTPSCLAPLPSLSCLE